MDKAPNYSHSFNYLQVSLDETTGILIAALNRPKRHNAIDFESALEFGKLSELANADMRVRVILVHGNGKSFSSGLDLAAAADLSSFDKEDAARAGIKFYHVLKKHQESFHSFHTCRVPVIMVVHGYCIGGAIDLSSAADIVISAQDTIFGIEEINLAMAADWGTIQRLARKTNSQTLLRELCYTGRRFGPKVAIELGLVHSVGGKTKEEALKAGKELAAAIAEKSPVGIFFNKQALNYAMEHSMADGLEQIRTANMAGLNSPDVMAAGLAKMQKKKATFPKL